MLSRAMPVQSPSSGMTISKEAATGAAVAPACADQISVSTPEESSSVTK